MRPADLKRFDDVSFHCRNHDFASDELITQDDVGELLNTSSPHIPEVCRTTGLEFRESGRALRADKSQALAIARTMATSAEIGLHLNVHSRSVGARMRGLIPSVGIGWDRKALVEKGIIPLGPTA